MHHLRRGLGLVLLSFLLACGGGGGGSPTEPSGDFQLSISVLILHQNLFATIQEAEVLLDGRTVGRFQSAGGADAFAGLQAVVPRVGAGRHEVRVVVTRQVGSPNPYFTDPDGSLVIAVNTRTSASVTVRLQRRQGQVRTGEGFSWSFEI